jgi:hypothetical protein
MSTALNIFDDLPTQLPQSGIHVESSDRGTTLVFPGLSNLLWILLGYAIGFGTLLWERQHVVRLMNFEAAAWHERYPTGAVIVSVLMLLGGTLYLFGRQHVYITNKGLCRYLSVFGRSMFGATANFAEITDITSDKYSGGPVIWIYKTPDDRFLIEFSSVVERDWVAERLQTLWKSSKPVAVDGA